MWAYRPQWWECSSTEGSAAGFLGSVEKNLFVFSAMWLGEGVFQSEVRFMLGFREMGCTVLEVLVVPGDDSISIFHCRQVWTSAKPWLLQELSAAPVCKTLFLFKCHPNYRSGSHVFLKDPPHSWNLAAPIPICCTSPTNTEVVLACFILRSEVSVRETKLPPLGLLFILFSIFNCIQKMLLEFGSCWGSSSDISGFTQAQGRMVQTIAIRLMKGFRFAWI